MASPFFSAYDTIGTPNGTWIKPGGNVVAYVRSTGVQSGDLPEVATNLVSTIAAGVARCRASMNDVVMVLPGHTETLTGTSNLFTPVAGAQVIGCGNPGSTNAPNVTISATGAGIALSAANMTLAGLNINSATAAVTGAIVVTGAGVTLVNNFISFTGALGANVAIQVTGAATFSLLDNYITVNSTAAIVGVTGAGSTNLRIENNRIRQSQGTGGGACLDIANTAGISGFIARNFFKTATGTAANAIFVTGAAADVTIGCFENYAADDATGSGILEPPAMALA